MLSLTYGNLVFVRTMNGEWMCLLQYFYNQRDITNVTCTSVSNIKSESAGVESYSYQYYQYKGFIRSTHTAGCYSPGRSSLALPPHMLKVTVQSPGTSPTRFIRLKGSDRIYIKWHYLDIKVHLV